MRKMIFQFSKKRWDDIFFSKEYHIYWLLKIFRDWKYGLFSSQKVGGNMIFIDYWKVLVLNFRTWEIRSFFEPKSWWKDDIYWLLKNSCFELIGDGKYSLSFSRKVDGKMILTWSFWAFHDIPGLRKYGFSCSVLFFFVLSLFKIFVALCIDLDLYIQQYLPFV